MIPMTSRGNVGTIGGEWISTPRLNTTTIGMASIGLTHLRLGLGDLIPWAPEALVCDLFVR